MDRLTIALICGAACLGMILAAEWRRGRRHQAQIERWWRTIQQKVDRLQEELTHVDLKTNARLSELERKMAQAEAPAPNILQESEDWEE